MKVLFVCSLGMQRSPTAEKVWKEMYPMDKTMSMGIRNFKDKRPRISFSEWADLVIVMEKEHMKEWFRFSTKKPIVLNIPDSFTRGQKELEDILRKKFDQIGMLWSRIKIEGVPEEMRDTIYDSVRLITIYKGELV